MPERDALVHLLGQVRLRLRAQAAVQGLVSGLTAGAAAASVALLAAGPLWAFVALGAGAGVGAALGAGRRISLRRCARAVDEASAHRGDVGEPRNGDRTLVALDLSEETEPRGAAGTGARSAGARPGGGATEFSQVAWRRAALADALQRARLLRAADSAPWRRPHGLGVAAVTLGALVLMGGLRFAPAPALDAPLAERQSADEALTASAEQRRRVAALARAAARLGDEALARLARELAAALGSIEAAGGADAAARRQLAELTRRAEALARREAFAEETAKVGEAIAALAGPELRATGDALARLDSVGAEAALARAASDSERMTTEQRERLADALERASAAARGALDHAAGAQQNRERELKRLEREREEARAAAPWGGTQNQNQRPDAAAEVEATRDRRLHRLERDLAESAEACRRDPAACARHLQRAAERIRRQGDEAQLSKARNELADAARSAEQRASRRDGLPGGEDERGVRPEEPHAKDERSARAAGVASDGGEESAAQAERGVVSAAERRFERRARGETPDEGEPGGGAEGNERDRQDRAAGLAGGPAPGGAGAQTTPLPGGEGAGGEAGDDPLGQPGPARTGGRRSRVDVASAEGPSRATVIESSARQGFAEAGYRPVFRAYEAAVEETLDTSGVPAHRRTLVRRYFQLIRPR